MDQNNSNIDGQPAFKLLQLLPVSSPWASQVWDPIKIP